MKKEFAPYEESLEMERLGFNERCLKSYYKTIGQLLEGHGNGFDTPCPTFSQAFRWFREKHDLLGVVQGRGYNHKRYYMHTINGEWHPSQSTFDIYEEAELACLRKLIEIVKQK